MSRILVLLILFFAACTSKKVEPLPPEIYAFPWETWQVGRTLDGEEFNNRFVIRADQLVRDGLFPEAEKNYLLADENQLSFDAKESLRLRIASVMLASDQPHRALDVLGGFYESRGSVVSYVRSEAALLFAYIYSRLGNFNQGLAWFSQAIRESQSKDTRKFSENGVLQLLSRLPDKRFYSLRNTWEDDPFLPQLFVRENKRRLNVGGKVLAFNSNPRFWEGPSATAKKAARAPKREFVHDKGIIVMLPLSGRYSRFGQSVRKGIELAFRAEDKKKISYRYEDSNASAEDAAATCEELAETGKYSVIIGPLLFSPSLAVADCAKRYGLKMISFTKKSDFQTDSDVFRLGMTVNDQVYSLVNAAIKTKSYKKLALVYPVNDDSRRFVSAFKEALSINRVKLLFEYPYYSNPIPDFTDLSQEIEIYKPDAIFVADDLNMLSRITTGVGSSLSKRVKFLGTAEWSDDKLLKRSASALDGIIFVSPYFPEGSDLGQQFDKSYRRIFGQAPDFLAAQGYDAAVLTATIVKQMQKGLTWRDAVSNVKGYQGLTGDIEISGSYGLKRHLKVVEYQGGRVKELSARSAPTYIFRGNNELKKKP